MENSTNSSPKWQGQWYQSQPNLDYGQAHRPESRPAAESNANAEVQHSNPEHTEGPTVATCISEAAAYLSGEEMGILHSAPKGPPLELRAIEQLSRETLQKDAKLRQEMNYIPNLELSRWPDPKRPQMEEQYWQAVEVEIKLRLKLSPPGYTLAGLPSRLSRSGQRIMDALQLIYSRDLPSAIASDLDIHDSMIEILKFLWKSVEPLLHENLPDEDHDDAMKKIKSKWATFSEDIRMGIASTLAHDLCVSSNILEDFVLHLAQNFLDSTRNELLNDNIAFQQKQIRADMQKGNEFLNWLEKPPTEVDPNTGGKATETPSDKMQFSSFLSQFVAIIGSSQGDLPNPLQLESDRIKRLRDVIQQDIFIQVCCALFKGLKESKDPQRPNMSSREFRERISNLLDGKGDDELEQRGIARDSVVTTVVLELMRQTSSNLPASSQPVCPEVSSLRLEKHLSPSSLSSLSEVYRKIQSEAHRELTKYVKMEAETMTGLDAAQMATRCQERTKAWHAERAQRGRPGAAQSGGTAAAATAAAVTSVADDEDGVGVEKMWSEGCPMAVMIAHMAVLHWRIWGPVLYLKN